MDPLDSHVQPGSTPRTPFFLLVGIAFSGDWRDFRRGLRVDPEHEISGLDQAYHGFLASIAGVQTAALF